MSISLLCRAAMAGIILEMLPTRKTVYSSTSSVPRSGRFGGVKWYLNSCPSSWMDLTPMETALWFRRLPAMSSRAAVMPLAAAWTASCLLGAWGAGRTGPRGGQDLTAAEAGENREDTATAVSTLDMEGIVTVRCLPR